MSGFLYLAQCGDLPRYKIGCTTDPASRIAALQSIAPYHMTYVRVLDVGSKGRAHAFEGMVLGWLHNTLSRGEWTSDVQTALALFDCVAPAVDVTDDYPAPSLGKSGARVAVTDEQLEFRLALADMEAHGVPVGRVFGMSETMPRRGGYTPSNWQARIDAALAKRAAA